MKKTNSLAQGKWVAMLGFMLLTGMNVRAVDPRFKWRTLDIKHFRIHYHQGEEPLARRVAGYAEEVHDKITKALGWETTQKTEVVLLDSQDISNGGAIPAPYNTIYCPVRCLGYTLAGRFCGDTKPNFMVVSGIRTENSAKW